MAVSNLTALKCLFKTKLDGIFQELYVWKKPHSTKGKENEHKYLLWAFTFPHFYHHDVPGP